MTEKEAEALLEKFRADQCTPEEIAIIESWHISEIDSNRVSLEAIDYEATGKEIWAGVEQQIFPVRRIPLFIRYAAAACIIGVLSTAIVFYLNKQNASVHNQKLATQILPGKNTATLTLANGKKILLNHATGTVANTSGIQMINDTVTGQVTLHLSGKPASNVLMLNDEPAEANTIATPRSGQYRLVLEDGTRVVLNASSVLRFTRFAAKERKVTLVQGEAYFDVSKDNKRPFFVNTSGQTIRVLGTHFSVSAYPKRPLKTTLAEGSIQLTSSSLQRTLLKPNQQATLLSNNGFQVIHVNAADELAWVDGYFLFNETPVAEVLDQLSRWYNVDADYHQLPNATIKAYLSRNQTLSELIKGLEGSNRGIKVTLTERGLSVTTVPKK